MLTTAFGPDADAEREPDATYFQPCGECDGAGCAACLGSGHARMVEKYPATPLGSDAPSADREECDPSLGSIRVAAPRAEAGGPSEELIERAIAALREYDDALCLHAGMIARKEKFTRAEGWGLVEELRARFNVVDLIRASGQPHEPRAALSPAAPSETTTDTERLEYLATADWSRIGDLWRLHAWGPEGDVRALRAAIDEDRRAASPSEQEGA